MRWFFLGIFLILLSLFLLEYRIVGQAVYGDGRYYWAFTRSLYFDHNLDISDEMAHLYSPESNNKPAFFGIVPEYTYRTQEIIKGFSLGISLVWLPFYILGDAATVVLQSIGVPAVRNGYSDPYQIVVGVGNILFVVTGLIILTSSLKRFFSGRVIVPALLLVLFTTNLLYYSGLDTINSHPFSFFLVSLLIWLYFHYLEKKDTKNLMVQAFVVGLLVSNRTQDALFVVIPLFAPLIAYKKEFLNFLNNWLFFIKKYGAIIIYIFLGYFPQILLMSIGLGGLDVLPHVPEHTPTRAFGLPVYGLGILFDPKLGIALYMPIFLIGILGLFLFPKKNRSMSFLFLAVFLLHFLLISSWHGWPQASYSMRYFISLLPLIAFGIAEVVKRLQGKFSLGFTFALIGVFIFHQLVMIFSFKLFLQDPTDVGSELSRSGKLKLQLIQQIDKATQNLPFR